MACISSRSATLGTAGTRGRLFYNVKFPVLQPKQFADNLISGRIYCTERALWKLGWFLRDFGLTQSCWDATT
ncbi:MAG TPA: hypothetical protein VFJ47_14815 [Terriglobales bacterium]|nr:hypothetical protein [Terriglobales bacterium]